MRIYIPRGLSSHLYWTEQRLRGRGGIRERLEWLRANQELSRDEMNSLAFGKLQAMVRHAYETVPYYRRVMDERGLCNIDSPEELRRLPLLTREVLLREQESLLSSKADHKTLRTNYSSGSTGQRAQFRQDLEFQLWKRAFKLRTYEWCGGWRLGDPFVLLWGSPIYWSFKQLADRVSNLLTNRCEFNTFQLSPELISSVLNKLVSLRPVLVSTYSNAIHLIAKEAQHRQLTVPGLRAIQGTSEPLPPALKHTMATVFGCEVLDKYGMRETAIVAHESPHNGPMLIQAENVFVEFLDDNNEPCPVGQPGRVVVTTLNNWSMPLLRYVTSDLAAPLPFDPAVGLPFPQMTPVGGRQQDLIMTPDGGHIDAYLFSFLLMRFDEIHWFQVVQRELTELTLRVYAPAGLTSRTSSAIIERIHRHTGYPFKVTFEKLDRMPLSSTGKFRLCVSDLAPTTSEAAQ